MARVSVRSKKNKRFDTIEEFEKKYFPRSFERSNMEKY